MASDTDGATRRAARARPSDRHRRTPPAQRLRSPEELDQLVTVTTPLGWFALGTVGFVVLAALVWGFVGSIPTTVSGDGILLRGGRIASVVALGTGKVTELSVARRRPGERGPGGRLDHPADARVADRGPAGVGREAAGELRHRDRRADARPHRAARLPRQAARQHQHLDHQLPAARQVADRDRAEPAAAHDQGADPGDVVHPDAEPAQPDRDEPAAGGEPAEEDRRRRHHARRSRPTRRSSPPRRSSCSRSRSSTSSRRSSSRPRSWSPATTAR